MKKKCTILLLVLTLFSVSLYSETKSIVSLADYEDLKTVWNNYFSTVAAFDSSLEGSSSLYQKKLLACLQDPSSRDNLQPYALGEVLFYSYFALESPLVTVETNDELETEIDTFFADMVSKNTNTTLKILEQQEIISNVFAFLSVSEPNIQLGLANDLKSFVSQIPVNVSKSGTAKFDSELEKITVYHAINWLNQLQTKTPERNSWIKLVNTPSVWYLIQNCEDFSILKNRWDAKGFGEKDILNLEEGYFSEKAQAVYQVQELLKNLTNLEAKRGVPSERVFPVYMQSIIEYIQQDEFLIFLCSEDDIKKLAIELDAFTNAINLWVPRINALAITGEATHEKN